METEALNWTAVLVGTVAAFIAGWVYYSVKPIRVTWAEGSRISSEPPERMPMMAMVLQVVGLFLLALVVGVTAQTSALFTAIFAILATSAMVMAQDAFSQKTTAAIVLDGVYVVLAGAIMIVCQGIF
ncbi:DUF1761 family protein [Cognatishimia maritima]|uniref:Twitching motility protein PilT n=1 Tax=Cognatishimia maritima TaxID=870908 RepID=A0A1M5J4R1_9RHOB|nr:DUF1761 family protein [Cognatishimia maritima]SHG35003.1 Protein of unknown function [Cognatishimia maritima]